MKPQTFIARMTTDTESLQIWILSERHILKVVLTSLRMFPTEAQRFLEDNRHQWITTIRYRTMKNLPKWPLCWLSFGELGTGHLESGATDTHTQRKYERTTTHTEEIWEDWFVHLNYTKCQNQDKPPKKTRKKREEHLRRLRLWPTCGDDLYTSHSNGKISVSINWPLPTPYGY